TMTNLIKRYFIKPSFAFILLLAICLLSPFVMYGQMHHQVSHKPSKKQKLPADTSVVSSHKITINGKSVPYQVEVGTLPVYGKDGKPDAYVQYTYFRRTDVKDEAGRPLMFSFNGGPGTASLWMMLGYTSPKRLK